LGNNHDNFELHRFTRRENTAKSFRGATFLTHTVYSVSTFDSDMSVGVPTVDPHFRPIPTG